MIRCLITSILSLMVFSLISQSASSSELGRINGNWVGTLTYTDYQDDSSQSTLGCKMEARWKNNKGSLTFLFTEPDGRVIRDKTKIRLKKGGTKMIFDGKYKVLEFSSNAGDQSWKLALGKSGKDNNKNSQIRLAINFSRTGFEIIKMVQYEGTDRFFERNRYVFEREE